MSEYASSDMTSPRDYDTGVYEAAPFHVFEGFSMASMSQSMASPSENFLLRSEG